MISSLGQQASEFWGGQSVARRITLIALLVSAIILIAVFIVWAGQPSYTVAYTGLSETDAGEIVQAFTEQNIPYKLRNTTTILVRSDMVYEARLAMAREGLPKASNVGFEVFSTNSLIMTEFTQQVNYQRALEGELERTILSLDAVEAAQVHIVLPEKSLLTEDQSPATASVTLQVAPGQFLDQGQVRSLAHLVASSVDHLQAEDVVIVDAEGNLLAGGQTGGDMAFVSQTDAQRGAEVSAAREIQARVQEMLDTVLGPDKSVVKASVVMDWTETETTSQSFDPTTSTIRSHQTIDEAYTSTGDVGGVPGADTNLPEEPLTVETTGQLLDYQRSEETLNYEVTQVQSLEVDHPGEVEKITISVLVDGIEDEEQLQVIEEAVIAAAGINQERGDIISVASMEFDQAYFEAQETDFQQQEQTELLFRIAQIAIPVIIIIAVLFFISRLFRNLRMASTDAWTPVMQPVAEAALPTPLSTQALIGAGLPQMEDDLEEADLLPKLPPLPEIKQLAVSPEDEQLIKAMTRMAEDSPSTIAEIIQLWLDEDES